MTASSTPDRSDITIRELSAIVGESKYLNLVYLRRYVWRIGRSRLSAAMELILEID